MAYTGPSNDAIANQELSALFFEDPRGYQDEGRLADRIHRRLQSLGYAVPDFTEARTLAKRALAYWRA